MKFGSIDIPKQIIAAKEQGQLVIFAGAGVSEPPPSNLPLFEELAVRIGAGTQMPRGSVPDVPLDTYLGSLESSKTDIRGLTYRELTPTDSQPSRLHKAICKISCGGGDKPRIITTNFDLHFSKCFKEDGVDVEQFHAPALPLGYSFEGLVYLHGSLAKSLNRIVLTDSDFGKAYLIDGWATRFLKEVFSNYTVLFVGYSHDDPVMRYIARGLPPALNHSRFIFTHEAEQSKWNHLGITPIKFPLDNGEDRFSKLPEGLELFSKHVSETFMDKELRIQDIVSKPPTLDPEAIDFIVHSLQKEETLQYFIKYCKSEDWLLWTHEQGYLNNLFDPNVTLNSLELGLSHWAAYTFIAEKPLALIKIIQSKKPDLHPIFLENLAFATHSSRKKIDAQTFTSLVTLLLSKMRTAPYSQILEYLLSDCNPEENPSPAMQLFSFLINPILKTGGTSSYSRLDVGDETTRIELTLKSNDRHWLPKAWDKMFRGHLNKYGEYVFHLLLEKIEIAHSFYELEGVKEYDSMSRKRASIARHYQNFSDMDSIDILFDFFSDVLEWVAASRPVFSDLVMSWLQTPRPLFKRFALYVGGRAAHLSAEAKLSWFLKEALFHDYDTHHEVFEFISKIYPQLGTSARKDLIAAIKSSPNSDYDELERGAWKEYPLYRIFEWLSRSDNACPLLKAELEQIKERNPQYEPTEFPDFHSWISSGWVKEEETPYTPEKLRELPFDESTIEHLATWKSSDRFVRSRSGLISAIEIAASQDPEWGLALCQYLVAQNRTSIDLFEGILNGFKKASLTIEQWKRLLQLFTSNPSVFANHREITDILLSGIDKKQNPIPDESIGSAFQLSLSLWSTIDETEENESAVADWPQTAINRSSGRLAEFWIKYIVYKNKNIEDKSIPNEIKAHFESILTGDRFANQLARVIISGQLLYLFSLDQDWTGRHLVPKFDLSVNGSHAVQCFQGYLQWGQWNDKLIETIRPYFTQGFSKLSLFREYTDRFIEYIAGIALYANKSPYEDNWLVTFFTTVDADTRSSFLAKLKFSFRNMKKHLKKRAWDLWLKRFVDDAVHGRPLSFSHDDFKHLIELTVTSEILPEALPILVKRTAPPMADSFLFHELNDERLEDPEVKHSHLINTNPREVLQLILYILPNQQRGALLAYDIEPISEKLINNLRSNVDLKPSLLELCNHLSRLGISRWNILRQMIENN